MTNEQYRILLSNQAKILRTAYEESYELLKSAGIGRTEKNILGKEYWYIEELEPLRSVLSDLENDCDLLLSQTTQYTKS